MTEVTDKTRSRFSAGLTHGSVPALVAVWPGGSNRVDLVPGRAVVVGRGADCDLRVIDGSVSRAHVRVEVDAAGTARITDLGSSNGTILAGVRMPPQLPMPFGPGMAAEMGDAMLLVQGAEPAVPQPQGGAAASVERPMARLNRLVTVVASSDINVILQGETGVGKEVTARRIHEGSARAHGAFVKINCAAFPETMVEAELFGFEKGAFTGAAQAKAGLVESAAGGTLLLDEVAELPAATQAKLLRAVGNHEVLRLGAVTPRPVDVRFVAATHEPFDRLIAQGRFRMDLFYRLNGVTLYIPPLRERRDEIPGLATAFLAEWSQRQGRAPLTLAMDAVGWLQAQSWPGNIRELRTTIERATLLCTDHRLERRHFEESRMLAGASMPDAGADKGSVTPRPIADTAPALDPHTPRPESALRDELSRLEREQIVDAMARCGGNQTRAAKMLGISRRALLYRLDVHGLPRPRKGGG